jgi:signal transduction histidine kinase
MAISYRIVQEHGGRIDVSSHEGAGTAITVSLPAAATMGNAVA